MKKLFVILAGIILIISAINVTSAIAAISTSSVIISQNRGVFVMINYGEASKGIPVIKARLEQDLHALENIFQQSLLQTGQLNARHPVLFVRANYHPAAGGIPATTIATISRTPTVAQVNPFPFGREGMSVPGGKSTEKLGRAYVIDTTADRLSFNDLLAFILLLPRLNEQRPVLNINNKEILSQIKNSQKYRDLSNLQLELRDPGMWNQTGKTLAPVWQAGILSYHVHDLTGNKLFELDPLEYYLTKPHWSPPMPRFITGATAKELFLVDTFSGKTHRLDLANLFPAQFLQMTDNIELTVSPPGDLVYITLSFNLPEEFWETENHTYVYYLNTGEIKVASQVESTKLPEPAPGRGVISEIVTPQPGYISPVVQLRERYAWPFTQLSRHQDFYAPHLANLLPRDNPLVFQPVGFFEQNRFIAYASQEEIVVFNTIAQEYHRLDVKELRPNDYQNIDTIRFAQNPNLPANKIYFFLESHDQTLAAYAWNIPENKLTQIDNILAEIQRDGQAGWWEFAPGANNFILPAGTVIFAGSEAIKAIIQEFLFVLVNAVLSLLIWLVLVLFIFLPPFVLANAITLLAAFKLKNARLFIGFGPAITAILFLCLSVSSVIFISTRSVMFQTKIENLVYPLLWFTTGRSSAAVILMLGFFMAVTIILTILVFYQARLLLSPLLKRRSLVMPQSPALLAVKKLKIPAAAGPLLTVITAPLLIILMINHIFFWIRAGDPIFLFLILYFIISSVFYLGRFISARLAKLLFPGFAARASSASESDE